MVEDRIKWGKRGKMNSLRKLNPMHFPFCPSYKCLSSRHRPKRKGHYIKHKPILFCLWGRVRVVCVDESRECQVFDMGLQESESLTCKVNVTLPYTTPVVGLKFKPAVRVAGITSLQAPQHNKKFSWLVSSTSSDHHFSFFDLFFWIDFT